jgi:predicted nucleotidyltransferase
MTSHKRLLTAKEKRKIKSILKRELTRRDEIVFAYLHGSFLLPIPCGDVDIAVYVTEEALSAHVWEYEADLTIHLEPQVRLPVDVLVLNRAPVTLRYHATCGELLVSKDEPKRYTFLEETWREYFDYQPLLEAFFKDLLY